MRHYFFFELRFDSFFSLSLFIWLIFILFFFSFSVLILFLNCFAFFFLFFFFPLLLLCLFRFDFGADKLINFYFSFVEFEKVRAGKFERERHFRLGGAFFLSDVVLSNFRDFFHFDIH